MKTENKNKIKINKIKKEKNKKYLKADSIFPKELLVEIQKYAQGELIYIPKPKDTREKWGFYTGSREVISERNDEIYRHFQSGIPIHSLADRYFLSVESIKRIVYNINKINSEVSGE
jgi:Mor family transcriptional regulator